MNIQFYQYFTWHFDCCLQVQPSWVQYRENAQIYGQESPQMQVRFNKHLYFMPNKKERKGTCYVFVLYYIRGAVKSLIRIPSPSPFQKKN